MPLAVPFFSGGEGLRRGLRRRGGPRFSGAGGGHGDGQGAQAARRPAGASEAKSSAQVKALEAGKRPRE